MSHALADLSLHFPETANTHMQRCIVRAPSNESDLAPRPLATLQLILDIEHSIAPANDLLALAVLALCVDQLFTEYVPVTLRRSFLNDDFLPVVADLVDDPFERLLELQILECSDAFRGDRDAGWGQQVVR
jgi:hypothetical protein